MRKGVSPVVATVLLIAIAVISAVAVWYWFSPLVSGTAIPATGQFSLTIQHVYYNSSGDGCISIDVNNNGGVIVPPQVVFAVLNSTTYAAVGYVNTSNASGIPPGVMLRLNITSNGNLPYNVTGVPKGQTFILRASSGKTVGPITGYVDYRFSC